MELTLTGIDDRTSPVEIRMLHGRGVELGILYSETPEGRNRYPSLDWIKRTIEDCPGRYALHVCGRAAREKIFNRSIDDVVGRFDRIQVNGRLEESEVFELCITHGRHEIITQNSPLDCGLYNHAILVDASGGRGKTPAEWKRPDTLRHVGFAGGLGLHNLRIELPKIMAVAIEPSWIDMEGRLRSESDWFSIASAMAAIDEFIGATELSIPLRRGDE